MQSSGLTLRRNAYLHTVLGFPTREGYQYLCPCLSSRTRLCTRHIRQLLLCVPDYVLQHRLQDPEEQNDCQPTSKARLSISISISPKSVPTHPHPVTNPSDADPIHDQDS